MEAPCTRNYAGEGRCNELAGRYKKKSGAKTGRRPVVEGVDAPNAEQSGDQDKRGPEQHGRGQGHG